MPQVTRACRCTIKRIEAIALMSETGSSGIASKTVDARLPKYFKLKVEEAKKSNEDNTAEANNSTL